jgi:hypothetical protein
MYAINYVFVLNRQTPLSLPQMLAEVRLDSHINNYGWHC